MNMIIHAFPRQFNIFLFFCLLLCNLLIQAFFSILINLLGFGLLLFVIFIYVKRNKNHFMPFLLLIFTLSNFRLLENQGGGWNLIAFPFLLLFIFNNSYGNDLNNNQSRKLLFFFLMILILSNFLGWLLINPLSFAVKIQNSIQFISYILILILLAKSSFTFRFFNNFVKIVAFINVYAFLVSLNQVLGLLRWTSPVFGADSAYFHVLRPFSLYGDFELYAEYSLLVFVFSFLLLITKHNSALNLSKKLLSVNLVFAFLNILISGTRSSLILSVFVLPIAFLFSLMKNAVFRFSLKNLFIISVLVAAMFTIIIQFHVGDTMFNRMSGLTSTHFTFDNIFSGETINRDKPYEKGISRIERNNWWLGYGSGILKSNLAAWWGTTKFTTVDDLPMFDFHSLYLCIPMIYGWIGSTAFFIIFIYMLGNLWMIFQNDTYDSTFRAIATALFTFWLFFFINEFKINFLRGASYQMLIWIWLGLSYSVIYSKQNFRNGQNEINGN